MYEVRNISNLYIRAPDETIRNADLELHAGTQTAVRNLTPLTIGRVAAISGPRHRAKGAEVTAASL
jgi:hypothetical protein